MVDVKDEGVVLVAVEVGVAALRMGLVTVLNYYNMCVIFQCVLINSIDKSIYYNLNILTRQIFLSIISVAIK